MKRQASALDKQQLVSAQVVLRAASGKSARSQEPITTQNIQDYTPTAEAVTAASNAFAQAGFEVGVMVGNNFSITAPAAVFERFFKTRLRQEGAAVKAGGARGAGSLELPLKALPSGLAAHVETITFSPPPDFGPTNW